MSFKEYFLGLETIDYYKRELNFYREIIENEVEIRHIVHLISECIRNTHLSKFLPNGGVIAFAILSFYEKSFMPLILGTIASEAYRLIINEKNRQENEKLEDLLDESDSADWWK